jgi:hypothetical protein
MIRRIRLCVLLAALSLGACQAMVEDTAAPSGSTSGNAGGGPATGGTGTGVAGGPVPGANADAGALSGGGVPRPPSPAVPGADGAVCARLVPVSALSFQDLPAAPGARLRVRAELASGGVPAVPWVWVASYGDGAGTEVSTTALDAEASLVELPLERSGRYSLTAFTMVGGGRCEATANAFAVPTDRQLAQFRLRLAPPAGLPYPTQDSAVQVKGGTPLSQPVVLQRGAEVVLEPHDASGQGGVSSYVRVTETRSALTVEGHTAAGPFRALLLPPFIYDVLFVPDGDVAPVLHTAKTPSALNVLPLLLTPGTALGGQVVDAGNRPVRDARVVLRAGALTSTVGPSDVTGAFSLRVHGGTFGVTVSPPPDTGLPELVLASDSGLTILEAASAGTADIAWAPVVTAAVSLAVSAPDGVRPAAGARVRLERDASLPGAGTLVLQPPSGAVVMRALVGYARAAGQADARGAVALPALPTGRYRVTMIPADGDNSGALTATTLDLGAAGATAAPMRLSAKVLLRGMLQPASEAAGTLVHASPRALDPPRPVATAMVGPDGMYQLAVDPGREYVVWADPPANRALARALLASVSSGVTGAEVPARALPRALPFTGTVSGAQSQGGVPAVVIQAFCDAVSPSCLDPTLPIAETVSGPRGDFTLALPDPGSL